MAMFERINGHVNSSVLGHYSGKNAVVSIAVGTAGDVAFRDTGAVAALAELQRYLNSTDDQVLLDFIAGKGIVRVDGTAFVLATVKADYTEAYAAQTNMKRLIDVVQQRAVIHAVSDIFAGDVAKFRNAPTGTTSDVAITAAEAISFIVERANVFDKDITTFQGVPTGVVDLGRNLIDDLSGVPMLSKVGVEIKLKSDASATAQGNFGIKVLKSFPAIV